MPTDTSVKFFTSAMSGAPSLTSAAGALIDLLDACLTNGFGSVTLDSLVISGNVATATKSAGHNFPMTGATGPVIRIKGATPAGLNGDWRIQTVPSSTTFTFTTSGISNQTATGTITAKRAPAGFEKVFSATGKAVYRALDVQSTRLYLRVDDTATATSSAWITIRMFETMTDVDTGTNGSTSYYVLKSNYSGNKNWRVYADSRAFWFVGDTFASGSILGIGQMFFGDLASPALPTDAWHCALAAFPTQATNGTTIPHMTDSGAMRLARSYNGVTTNVAAFRRGHMLNTTVVSNGGAGYQAAIGPLVKAVEVFEGTTAFRGLMPGWYGQVHANLSNWVGTYYEHPQIGTLRGDNLYCNGDYNQFFDITGPWR